jgi:HEAT repeat protein
MLRFGPPDVDKMAEKADVKGLMRTLSKDRDVAIRVAAAYALASLASDEACPALLAALEDPSPDVRQAAVQALAAQGGEPVVDALLKALRDPDEAVSQGAVRALGALGDARAVGPLLALAEGEQPYLRDLAADALVALGMPAVEALSALLLSQDEARRERGGMLFARMGETALAFLKGLLKEDNRDTRWRAVEAVARISGEEAMALLAETLGDSDYYVREACKAALAERGQTALPQLCDLLQRESVALRQGAIEALERIGSPLAFEPLLAMLQPEAVAVRRVAISALTAVGGVRAIAPLSGLLHDRDIFTRRTVVESLAKLHAPESQETLLAALRDTDEAVRRTASDALKAMDWQPDEGEAGARYWASQKRWERCTQMGAAAAPVLLEHLAAATASDQRIIRVAIERMGAAALPTVVNGLHSPDLNVRVEAAGLVARMGDEEVVEALSEALRDPERRVREAAATALGELGEPAAIPALLGALSDLERSVQQAAGAALATLGFDETAVLAERLAHSDWHVRRGAIMALGCSHAEEAVELLLPHLHDAEANVRSAAAESLVRQGKAAVGPLVRLLGDEDQQTRHAAISILAQIKDRRALTPLLDLLWHSDQTTRAATLQALQAIGPDEKPDVGLVNRIGQVYVLVCGRDEFAPDEWSQLAHDALMDLQEKMPALQWAHAVALSDLTRLHVGFHRFVPSPHTFADLVTAFRAWIGAQGVTIEEWDRRFFHREMLDPPELEEVDCVLAYYHA